MHQKFVFLIALSLLFFVTSAWAEHVISLDEIDVRAPLIDSRILKHPATVETSDRQQISENINAATVAQTLKYLPSIQVRERFIGDRNGIIATRTAGTLSSAQSMLYADGVLLSNLLGNSYGYPPRWGLITPEEVESISMMYGPFSALYAGNSFGGVMSLHTRMPEKFESHATGQTFMQNFSLYGTNEQYHGYHLATSVGNKVNDFSFWLGVDYLENQGQPMGFATNPLSVITSNANSVTGAYQDKDVTNADRVVFGANSIEHVKQTDVKFKASYDITPNIKVAYTIGLWDLNSTTDVQSYIKDRSGSTVYNNTVSFNNNSYNVTGLSPGRAEALHIMQALAIKSDNKSFFDWELNLSDFNYQKDKNNSSTVSSNSTTDMRLGNPYLTRIGTVTNMQGTGWMAFEARGTLHPVNHTLDVGYHFDQYELRSGVYNTADWSIDGSGTLKSAAQGDTRTQAVYLQDKWQLDPKWALTMGARSEHWEASNGLNKTSANNAVSYADRSENRFSPKLSLSFELQPDWGFRASYGQAYRFPTVSEMFQLLQNGSTVYYVASNPDLKPEQVKAGELTAERRFDNGLLRVSLFHEDKYDALISQTFSINSAIPYDTGTCTRSGGCGFIQNVDHIRTRGVETSAQWQDVLIHGLDLQGSATFTDAEVLANAGAPTTVGNKPTRIPKNMFKLVTTYHQGHNWTYSLAARYSGRQYTNLSNTDVNPDTYGGASNFFVMDAKVNYKFADRFTLSIGMDNINNYKSYVAHPYPQRTTYLQAKFDY
jgi:iron complex outermembrane receptor protein